MSCNLNVIEQCTRVGDTVPAIVLSFDIDISEKLFFYEYSGTFYAAGFLKSIGNGLTLSGANNLIIDSYTEDRRPGTYNAYLKCIDQDGENTILQWKITVKPQLVHNGNS